MTAVFRRVWSACRAVWGYIPNPLHWVFGEPWPDLSEEESECEFCKQEQAQWAKVPDDLREAKLDKEMFYYNLKLDNIKPRHWKVLGTNLLNMAYKDPNYDNEYESNDELDGITEDELPPPDEPSEEVKALETPNININLKYQTFYDLEEFGEMFFEWADVLETTLKGEKWPGYPNLPYYHDQPKSFYEQCDAVNFDPQKKIMEEITEIKNLTLSDLVPDVPKVPYRDDVDELFSYKAAYPPPSVDPELLEVEEKIKNVKCVEDTWMTHLTQDPYVWPRI